MPGWRALLGQRRDDPPDGRERRLEGFLSIFRDNTAEHASAERHSLMLAEMAHHTKRMVASAQSVALQTLRDTGLNPDVRASLGDRLIALARSCDVALDGPGGVPLFDVLSRALFLHGDPDQFDLTGPPVRVQPEAVQLLGLALHELATNAVQHGALSTPQGRVSVQWIARPGRGGHPRVEITWCERGGPPVRPPSKRGFGRRVLERGLAHELRAEVGLDFDVEGLVCRIDLPLASHPDRPAGGKTVYRRL
ncbi:sensor histidine kinase [Roseomonas vastitatis]|uniref:histidine kinase n=2 Tax=Teichococcus vastitatis TaxID=2307076 RepID=A0ABS9W2L4_9PROT|nr:sensor histidine kinase [Pseudoroseomonas vastitatis]